jgi:UTP:GlnB (protein PII) uridylyltransferase
VSGAKQSRTKYLPAIFAAAREKGVTHEQLHETIWVSWQKKSLKDLTAEQAGLLIDGLRGKSQGAHRYRSNGPFTPRRREAMQAHGRKDYDRSGDAVYMVNARELAMLREAAEVRGWSEETLRQFTKRQIGHETPRTMAELNKVFWPLKAMNRRDNLCK